MFKISNLLWIEVDPNLLLEISIHLSAPLAKKIILQPSQFFVTNFRGER